jgi:hypothetical protein
MSDTKQAYVAECFFEEDTNAVFIVVQMMNLVGITSANVAFESVVLTCRLAELSPVLRFEVDSVVHQSL